MGSNKSFDFKSFISANAGQRVSAFDYLHTEYKALGLASDFILYFVKLCWPDFKVVDDLVYILELFEDERYRSMLAEGKSSTETQFWMNLLEITGLFDGLSTDQAMLLAESLVNSWNSKLRKEFVASSARAKAICDERTGEVFVTIGSADSVNLTGVVKKADK